MDFPIARLASALENEAGIEVALQLESVVIPIQKPDGVPTNFSVLARIHPRPRFDEVRHAVLVEEEDISLHIGSIEVIFSLNEFRIINWIRFKGAPEIYKLTIEKIQESVANGDTRWYWE